MSMRLKALIVAALAFLGGGLLAVAFVPQVQERLLPLTRMVTSGKALVGGPFTLTDHTGKRVTDKDFRGKYMLVFFGFTFCPDVCPGSLQVMTEALEQLGKKAERVTPLFISVDTERDTPEELARYVKSFHPTLVGLTGSPEDVAAAAKAYRVIYRRVKDERSTAGFTYDHTTFFYLMDPNGEFVTHFNHGLDPKTLAERLGKYL
jgi:protein SCO1/2